MLGLPARSLIHSFIHSMGSFLEECSRARPNAGAWLMLWNQRQGTVCCGGSSRSTGHILDFDLPAALSQAGRAVPGPAQTALALRSRGRGCFLMSSFRDPAPFRPVPSWGPQGEAGARSGSWRLGAALGVVGGEGDVGTAPRPSRTVSWRPLVTRRRTRAPPDPARQEAPPQPAAHRSRGRHQAHVPKVTRVPGSWPQSE